MNNNERSEFARLLTAVNTLYRVDTSDFQLDVFWTALSAYDFGQVKRAFNTHVADPDNGRFAPKLADMTRILHGTHGDRAAMAWGKVLDAMRLVGAYQDVAFDDPAIHAAIEDAGGWPKLCRSKVDELGYVQTAFCKSHRAYTGRGTFPYPSLCHGDRSPDWEYEKKGLPLPTPVLIGDPARVAQVMAGGAAGGKTAISFQSVQALLPVARRRFFTTTTVGAMARGARCRPASSGSRRRVRVARSSACSTRLVFSARTTSPLIWA
ncbi:DUF6475 domain-containing protein [Polaromonas sp.]|uniref:DUF6475 domain-containing protein n=1 Tax=Polaromonas sp. TaxID=1869339 RepID=UPI00352B3F81